MLNVLVTTCPPQHFGVFWLCICWVWWGKPRNSISLRSVAAPLGTRLRRSKSSLDRQLKVTNLLLWLEGSWQWDNFQKCWTNDRGYYLKKKCNIKILQQYIQLIQTSFKALSKMQDKKKWEDRRMEKNVFTLSQQQTKLPTTINNTSILSLTVRLFRLCGPG